MMQEVYNEKWMPIFVNENIDVFLPRLSSRGPVEQSHWPIVWREKLVQTHETAGARETFRGVRR